MIPNESNQSENASFLTTNWSMVMRASARGSPEAEQALATLCETYWYPLFAFARRQGYDVAQGQDYTQGFFEKLLEKDYLETADADRGRFRSFLLAAFKHYLANEHRAARRQKRGGDRQVISIDVTEAEERYAREPFHEETAERFFERQWAVTLLDHVVAMLEYEHEQAGKKEMYDQLKVFLGGEGGSTYRESATRLGMSEGAVKVAVHRLRQRVGALVRQEIERIVADPGLVDEEINRLFAALSA